jgi:hypothetical protein
MGFAFNIKLKDLKMVDGMLMVKRDVNVVKFTSNGTDYGVHVVIID